MTLWGQSPLINGGVIRKFPEEETVTTYYEWLRGCLAEDAKRYQYEWLRSRITEDVKRYQGGPGRPRPDMEMLEKWRNGKF